MLLLFSLNITTIKIEFFNLLERKLTQSVWICFSFIIFSLSLIKIKKKWLLLGSIKIYIYIWSWLKIIVNVYWSLLTNKKKILRWNHWMNPISTKAEINKNRFLLYYIFIFVSKDFQIICYPFARIHSAFMCMHVCACMCVHVCVCCAFVSVWLWFFV